jgi:tetratricopeptide (TPR) repeat protein
MKPIIYSVLFALTITACKYSGGKTTENELLKEDLFSMKKEADILYDQNKYEKALKLFDKIISVDSLCGDSYYKRAYCKALLSDYEGSTRDYEMSIKLSFRIEDSYFSLGCNYAIINEDSLAIEFFEKAYAINPKNTLAKEQIDWIKKKKMY